MQTINHRKIKYLYEAVTAGSIRTAADRLNIAPSAISRQISQLEQEIGLSVIERGRRGVISTEVGDVLLRYYSELQGLEDTYLRELNQLKGLAKGRLELAVGEGFVPELINKPVALFNRKHPGITLSITTSGTNDVIRKIEMSEAHIGLVYHPPKQAEIRTHSVNAQPIEAVVNVNHPIARQQTITLEQLLTYPIALLDSTFGVQQMLHLAAFQARISLDPALTTNSFAAIKQFAIANLGVTVLPAFVAAKEIDEGILVSVPIDNPILKSGETHVITRVGRTLPPSATTLLSILHRWLNKM
ncbi:LysR family transcriptional regulator [Photobacterium sp.]|uniref:LysR family transcriptional regulator n=1 Tax=Photobacterium sp. TaxID=660 RepID=UPI00299EEBD9|nr:LysR family transcriptional regulator [Photobacterium sp.]MDX1303590.1 LysR family transcriptional regulator [Photobacterium sp.]